MNDMEPEKVRNRRNRPSSKPSDNLESLAQ